MNKKYFLFIIAFAGAIAPLSSQDVLWKAGVHSFFDNYEFAGSSVQTSQTMAGVHLVPEIGLQWEEQHRIFAGVDLMHEWGSRQSVDFHTPIIYYEYAGEPFKFYAGAIPRRELSLNYPRMFFSDSILNYRPAINGIFWEYGQANSSSANVWLDWTGRQTHDVHESFFMGWSGKYCYRALRLQHFGYMFHLAAVKDPEVDVPVHDNGLMLTSLGVALTEEQTGFGAGVESNLGWTIALDRDRGAGIWHTPQGLLWETKLGYKMFELFNTYYKGGRQQVFYNSFGNTLYWGDTAYRSGEYDRLDLSIYFIKNYVVDVKLSYSLHFLEKNLYHQQALYVVFNLGR